MGAFTVIAPPTQRKAFTVIAPPKGQGGEAEGDTPRTLATGDPAQNPIDQAAETTPFARQAYRVGANVVDSVASLGDRAMSVVHGALDEPAFAQEYTDASKARLANMAAREQRFTETSSGPANFGAGVGTGLGKIAVASLAGPEAIVPAFSADAANQAWNKGEQAGLSPSANAAQSVEQAVLAGIGATPLGRASKALTQAVGDGIKSAIKRAVEESGRALGPAEIATIGSRITDKISGVNPADITPEELRDMVAETAAATYATVGALHVAGEAMAGRPQAPAKPTTDAKPDVAGDFRVSSLEPEAATSQPKETPNVEEVQAEGQGQAAQDVLAQPAGVEAQSEPAPAPAPESAPTAPVEASAPEVAQIPTEAPVVPPQAAQEAISPTVEPLDTPVRFKRTGKGDTTVHEATLEGRDVSIAKGKDGWEVRLDGKVADVHPTLTKAREYATGELRQDLRDQRNADEEGVQIGDAEVTSGLQMGNNPPPADTGIYRDLTAAAREGKRFVADLHERVAPILARIHASAKNAVDFVRQAVAKIGEHIRPYATRFAAEVKRGARDETGARITLKGIRDAFKKGPLANPGTTDEARGFVNKVDAERELPDAQTRAQWAREAAALDRDEIMDKLQSGKTFGSAPEVIAAKNITDESAWNAISKGEDVASSWHIADAWRKTGTEAARILGARFDPILSASERAQVAQAHKDLAEINTALDDPAITDEQHAGLMTKYADTQQKINDVKVVGTVRRMLSQIFTSPRKTTEAKLKALDAAIADRTLSDADRGRKQAERDKASNAEGKALEEMRRRMVASGVPLDDPVEMGKRDNLLRALNEAKAHKSTWPDKLEELYKNLLFSGSTPTNVIDNAIIMANEFVVNKPLEMALNGALKIDPRAAGFSDTSHMLGAIAPGLRRGIRNMIDSWRTEADMFELQTHGPNMNVSGKLEGRGAAIPGKLGRAVRGLGYRPLMATDSFNKSLAAEIEVAGFANRLANERGLTGRAKERFIQRQSLDYDSPSWQHAVNRAEVMTLTDEAGKTTKAVTELRDKAWPLRFFLPVIKTPVKALSMATRKTPLGSARIAYKLYKDPKYTRAYLAHDLAEQAAAWTVAAGLYAMLHPGDKENTGLPHITGDRPYSQKNYRENKNKEYITPARSIRFGDTWYKYGKMGVAGDSIATTVDALEALAHATKDPVGALSEFMVNFMGKARDATWLGNMNDIGQAFEEGGFPTKWASNFAASWSPSAAKRVARALDPKERETRALTPGQKLNYKILPTNVASPLTDVPPPDVSLFGQEVVKHPQDYPRSDFVWKVLSQSDATDMGQRDPFETDMYRMFMNWNNQHADDKWAPDAPQLKYKLGKTESEWTPDQYHDLSVLAGQWSLDKLKQIGAKKAFNYDTPTERDKAIVSDVLESGRKYAKEQMIIRLKSESAGRTPAQTP